MVSPKSQVGSHAAPPNPVGAYGGLNAAVSKQYFIAFVAASVNAAAALAFRKSAGGMFPQLELGSGAAAPLWEREEVQNLPSSSRDCGFLHRAPSSWPRTRSSPSPPR